jgi:phosphoenolpyruvate carboxykinase (ATP)
LPTPAVYEQIARRSEGMFAHHGPVVMRTGQHTGRSPNDKFIVREPSSSGKIWWGEINRPFGRRAFERVQGRQAAYLQGKDLFVEDCYAGADPQYRLPIRVITETAWHNLFARNMFIRELDPGRLADFQPAFTVIHTPNFLADPESDGTASDAFVLLDLERRLVLIGGTAYAGEIKKSVFTIMNYVLPHQKVLSLHCSANYGKDTDDVALLLGLSGTGKTTLSTSSGRTLIGDDEHGWSEQGVFNFEGGCYAKVIRISSEGEPEIYDTTRKFGTILENVGFNPLTRRLDLADDTLTENTRASYPITHIPSADRTGMGGHPRNVIFLTYDAYGVLPPISRLTPDEAAFHFLVGYTSKVAGTEKGIDKPKATFSACFGAPFMPLKPTVYAELLKRRIAEHQVGCWLVNTGLTGGPHGKGRRVPLEHTRAMVAAALDGRLAKVSFRPVEMFRASIPERCPDVPQEMLSPRETWSSTEEYDRSAQELSKGFEEAYEE